MEVGEDNEPGKAQDAGRADTLASPPVMRSGSSNDSGRHSETESLTKSLYDSLFVTRGGRRYHNVDSVYSFPNDDEMLDIQDAQHKLYSAALKRLQFSPLESPQRVLDCGTGTGTWAIDFAIQHPEATVLGVDLSPVQYSDHSPPNVSFECDNIMTGLRAKMMNLYSKL